MCNDPTIFSPLSGCCLAYSSRTAISPGISCSASMISLRPQSARLMSATLYSSLAAPFLATPLVFAGLLDGLVRFGAVMVRDIRDSPLWNFSDLEGYHWLQRAWQRGIKFGVHNR